MFLWYFFLFRCSFTFKPTLIALKNLTAIVALVGLQTNHFYSNSLRYILFYTGCFFICILRTQGAGHATQESEAKFKLKLITAI